MHKIKFIYSIALLSFIFSTHKASSQDKLSFETLIDSADTYLNSNTKKAEYYYNKALKILQNNKDDIKKRLIYTRLGIVNRIKADYPKAIDYHLKSLEINTKINDSSKIAENYHNIAMVLRYQNDYDAAKNYFTQAISIREKLKDTINLGVNYNMLGIIHRLEGDYDTAETYYFKAFSIFKSTRDTENVMSTFDNLSILYDLRKDYKNAIKIKLQTIPYYKSINKQTSLSNSYSNIAFSYEKLNNHQTAIAYLDSAIAIDMSQGYLEDLSANYLFRSNSYNALNNHKKALEDYKIYKEINDSVFNIKKTKEITTQFLQVDFEKQQALDSIQFLETEKQLELVATKEKNRKNIYLLLLIGASVLGIFTYNSLKIKRNLDKTKLENKKLESELLQQKLSATEREAQRIIGEKSISLTHKKNLVSQIKHLIKKQDVKSIFTDLNMLTIELNEQTKTETLHYILDETMEKLHVEFEQKLIKAYPDLTKTEREICSLIRSKMSIKDIVNIKGVSSASVQSARYRIRKKLKLKKGEELQQYLQELF